MEQEQITEKQSKPFCKALVLVFYGLLIKIGKGVVEHLKDPPEGFYVGPFR